MNGKRWDDEEEIFSAARNGDVAMVESLLSLGIDLETEDKVKWNLFCNPM